MTNINSIYFDIDRENKNLKCKNNKQNKDRMNWMLWQQRNSKRKNKQNIKKFY